MVVASSDETAFDAVKLLIEKGAEIDDSALYRARAFENYEILEYLLLKRHDMVQ
jgi:hypothetical protein